MKKWIKKNGISEKILNPFVMMYEKIAENTFNYLFEELNQDK